MSDEQEYQDYLDYQDYQAYQASQSSPALEPEADVNDASWYDYPLSLYSPLTRALSGGLRMVEDATDLDLGASRIRQTAQGMEDRVRHSLGAEPGSIGSAAYGTVQFLPQLPILAAGGLWGSTALLSGQTLGDVYGLLREEDVDPGPAFGHAAFDAAIQAPLNAIPAGILTREGMGPLTRAGLSAATGSLTNTVGTGVDLGTVAHATGEAPSTEAILNSLFDASLSGAAAPAVASMLPRGSDGATPVTPEQLADAFMSQLPNETKTSLPSALELQLPQPRTAPDPLAAAAAKVKPTRGIVVDESRARSPELQASLENMRDNPFPFAKIELTDDFSSRPKLRQSLEPAEIEPTPNYKRQSALEEPASILFGDGATREAGLVDPAQERLRPGEIILDERLEPRERIRFGSEGEGDASRDILSVLQTKREADRGVYAAKRIVRDEAVGRARQIISSDIPDKPKALFDIARNESGVLRIGEIFQPTWELVSKRFDETLGGQSKPGAPSEMWLQGRDVLTGFERNKFFAASRKRGTYARTVGEKYPHAKPATDAANHKFRDQSFIEQEMIDHLEPYLAVKDRTKIDEALAAARIFNHKASRKGATVRNLSDEHIQSAYKFTPEEMAAYQSMRATMRYAADKPLRELLHLKYPNDTEAVNAYVDNLMTQDYVPASRFGDGFEVSAEGSDTLEPHLSFYQNKKEALQVKKSLEQKYGAGKVTMAPRVDMVPDAFEGLPRELLQGNGKFDPNKWTEIAKAGKPQPGFTKHLISASLTPGFEKNIGKSASDYLLSLANAVARERMSQKMDATISQIDGAKEPNLVTFLQELKEDIYRPKHHNFWDGMRKLNTFYTLAAVPATAWTNLTQQISVTYPTLQRVTGSLGTSTRIMTRAEGVTAKLFGNWTKDHAPGTKGGHVERFYKELGDLGLLIKESQKEGILEGFTADVLRNARMDVDGKLTFAKVTDKMMIPFTAAEMWNRYHALIAGYEAGKHLKLEGKELFEYAKDFVDETQFIQNDAGRPAIQRSPLGKNVFQFKNYQGNYFRWLRKNVRNHDWAPIAMSITAQGMLGGALAVPGMNWVMSTLEGLGFDPKKAVRDFFDDDNGWMSTAALYGLPAEFGINLSRNLQVGDIDLSIDRDPLVAVGKLAAGPSSELITRPFKALEFYNRGEPGVAFETAAPRGFRGPIRAARAAINGEVRDSTGKQLMDDPSTGELTALASGFTPTRLSESYEKRNTTVLNEKNADTSDYHFNLRLGKALGRGDTAEYQSIIREIRQYNKSLPPGAKRYTPNKSAITRTAREYRSPQSRGTYP